MYNILVVDDEARQREAVINSVDWQRAGFNVVGDAENGIEALEQLEKLEPDMKVFCFEKENELYENLSPERQEEEKQNMINGFHFANKVVETGDCDLLVLDEVLGLLDIGILTIQDIYRLIEHCGNEVSLLMTGKYVPKELLQHIDIVSEIVLIKNMA